MSDRLADLRRKLAARTDREGKPKGGWAVNVAELKAEIARLEALNG